MDTVIDAIVLGQLLETLPPDLCVWLGEQRSKTAEEAARLADNYVTADKSEIKKSPLAATADGRPTEEKGYGGQLSDCILEVKTDGVLTLGIDTALPAASTAISCLTARGRAQPRPSRTRRPLCLEAGILVLT